jgi:hypothetical protein
MRRHIKLRRPHRDIVRRRPGLILLPGTNPEDAVPAAQSTRRELGILRASRGLIQLGCGCRNRSVSRFSLRNRICVRRIRGVAEEE